MPDSDKDKNALIRLVYESHGQDARYNLLGDICETVSAKYGTGGGGNVPIVVEINEDIHRKTLL